MKKRLVKGRGGDERGRAKVRGVKEAGRRRRKQRGEGVR